MSLYRQILQIIVTSWWQMINLRCCITLLTNFFIKDKWLSIYYKIIWTTASRRHFSNLSAIRITHSKTISTLQQIRWMCILIFTWTPWPQRRRECSLIKAKKTLQHVTNYSAVAVVKPSRYLRSLGHMEDICKITKHPN